MKQKKKKKSFRQQWPLYVMALPGVIVLLAFSYFPMAGIILVFKQYNFKGGIFGSPWADPIYKNFVFFFNNWSTAMRSTSLTVMYNLLFFAAGTALAVAIAIMLGEVTNKIFIKVSQSFMFLPYFISWMVIGAILNALINSETGLISQAVNNAGGTMPDLYALPKPWILILVLVNTWQSCGYSSIIYYGVISGIDSSLYEAARVDGASKWQCIKKITLPLLKPTIIIMFLLSVGNMLKGNLNMIIGLTNLNPVLFPTTDLIDVFVYRSGVRNGEMAFASAVSLYQSVFGLILVLVSNKIAGKFDEGATLF
ncbi:MAG: ABC transporter permease subunit [Lachnospiraceae bacterium]|nr:ABC transporter permease subunit [Lachnospiraceae bacterium]